MNRYIFRQAVRQNDVHISAPVTLIFDLGISKLLCQLVLTLMTPHQGLNVVWFSVFHLTVGT